MLWCGTLMCCHVKPKKEKRARTYVQIQDWTQVRNKTYFISSWLTKTFFLGSKDQQVLECIIGWSKHMSLWLAHMYPDCKTITKLNYPDCTHICTLLTENNICSSLITFVTEDGDYLFFRFKPQEVAWQIRCAAETYVLHKRILPTVFVYSSPTFFTIADLTSLFFLLKNLRYFKVYNINQVCKMKNHICENLMYLKIFCRKNAWSKLLQ